MQLAPAPSLVTRLAFLPATDIPFLRSKTTACSRSPLASVRACLQSIIGAPVLSRSSFTCAAEIFTVDVLIDKFPVSCFQFQIIATTKNYPAARNGKPKTRNYLTNVDPRRTTRAGLFPSGAKARISETPYGSANNLMTSCNDRFSTSGFQPAEHPRPRFPSPELAACAYLFPERLPC